MTDHDQSLFGANVLGVLEPGEVHEVEEHVPFDDYRQSLDGSRRSGVPGAVLPRLSLDDDRDPTAT